MTGQGNIKAVDKLLVINGVDLANVQSVAKVLTAENYQKLQNILDAAPCKKAAALWRKFEPYFHISDKNKSLRNSWGLFRPSNFSIEFNENHDASRNFGTLIHECGHFIDALFGENRNNKNFSQYQFSATFADNCGNLGALEIAAGKDTENLLEMCRISFNPENGITFDKHCENFILGVNDDKSQSAAQDKSNDTAAQNVMLSQNSFAAEMASVRSDISDILSGVTRGKIPGVANSHSIPYMRHVNGDKVHYMLCTEIFAEFFSNSITAPEGFKLLINKLPNTYKIFNSMLDKLNPDFVNDMPAAVPTIETLPANLDGSLYKFPHFTQGVIYNHILGNSNINTWIEKPENKLQSVNPFKVIDRNGNKLKLLNLNTGKETRWLNIKYSTYYNGREFYQEYVELPYCKYVTLKIFAENFQNVIETPAQKIDVVPQIEIDNNEKDVLTMKTDLTGKISNVITDDEKIFEIRYKIVECNEVIASHLVEGNAVSANPKYPAELQPRNRENRVAMHLKTLEMVSNIRPDDLFESRNLNQGAPVIRNDGVILNGNGRTIALTVAYDEGKANHYRDFLIENAPKIDINPDAISSYLRPLLVREITTPLTDSDIQSIIQSTAGGCRLGASEQAKIDANNIKTSTFALYAENYNGDLNTVENQNFVSSVLQNITNSNDINAYICDNGKISVDGVNRVKRALIAAAFNDTNVIGRMTESTDDNIKQISNALLNIAPAIAILNHKISVQAAYPYELAKYIAAAANKLSSLRDENKPVQTYLKEQVLFTDIDYSDEVKAILLIFDKNKRSAKNITSIFKIIISNIYQQGSPVQSTLFGDIKPAELLTIITTADKYFENDCMENLFENPAPVETPASETVTTLATADSETVTFPANETVDATPVETLADVQYLILNSEDYNTFDKAQILAANTQSVFNIFNQIITIQILEKLKLTMCEYMQDYNPPYSCGTFYADYYKETFELKDDCNFKIWFSYLRDDENKTGTQITILNRKTKFKVEIETKNNALENVEKIADNDVKEIAEKLNITLPPQKENKVESVETPAPVETPAIADSDISTVDTTPTADNTIKSKISFDGKHTSILFFINGNAGKKANDAFATLENLGFNFDTSYEILLNALLYGSATTDTKTIGKKGVKWSNIPVDWQAGWPSKYWGKRNLNQVANALITKTKIKNNYKPTLKTNISSVNALIEKINTNQTKDTVPSLEIQQFNENPAPVEIPASETVTIPAAANSETVTIPANETVDATPAPVIFISDITDESLGVVVKTGKNGGNSFYIDGKHIKSRSEAQSILNNRRLTAVCNTIEYQANNAFKRIENLLAMSTVDFFNFIFKDDLKALAEYELELVTTATKLETIFNSKFTTDKNIFSSILKESSSLKWQFQKFNTLIDYFNGDKTNCYTNRYSSKPIQQILQNIKFNAEFLAVCLTKYPAVQKCFFHTITADAVNKKFSEFESAFPSLLQELRDRVNNENIISKLCREYTPIDETPATVETAPTQIKCNTVVDIVIKAKTSADARNILQQIAPGIELNTKGKGGGTVTLRSIDKVNVVKIVIDAENGVEVINENQIDAVRNLIGLTIDNGDDTPNDDNDTPETPSIKPTTPNNAPDKPAPISTIITPPNSPANDDLRKNTHANIENAPADVVGNLTDSALAASYSTIITPQNEALNANSPAIETVVKNKSLTKLNNTERKAAKKIIEAAINAGKLYSDDEKLAYLVIEMIERWEKSGEDYVAGRFTNLGVLRGVFDLPAVARGTKINYFSFYSEEYTFYIATTYDLDTFEFNTNALDFLVVMVLKEIFKHHCELDYCGIDSCREAAGSKYRATHAKLAQKIIDELVAESVSNEINATTVSKNDDNDTPKTPSIKPTTPNNTPDKPAPISTIITPSNSPANDELNNDSQAEIDNATFTENGFSSDLIFDYYAIADETSDNKNEAINAQIKIARNKILNAPAGSIVVKCGRSWTNGENRTERGFEYEILQQGKEKYFHGYQNRRYILNGKNIGEYFGLLYQRETGCAFVYTATQVWLLTPNTQEKSFNSGDSANDTHANIENAPADVVGNLTDSALAASYSRLRAFNSEKITFEIGKFGTDITTVEDTETPNEFERGEIGGDEQFYPTPRELARKLFRLANSCNKNQESYYTDEIAKLHSDLDAYKEEYYAAKNADTTNYSEELKRQHTSNIYRYHTKIVELKDHLQFLEKMANGVNYSLEFPMLEPSAGNGDLIAACYSIFKESCIANADRMDFDCIEINAERAAALKENGLDVIWDDFLTFDPLTPYSTIIMNPPFKSGVYHLSKAIDILAPGGRLFCILNAETIKNPYSRARQELIKRLENGADFKIEYVQDAFKNQGVSVEVALIYYRKTPRNNSVTFDNFKKTVEEIYTAEGVNDNSNDNDTAEMTKYDATKAMISRYRAEVKATLALYHETLNFNAAIENSNLVDTKILEINFEVKNFGGHSDGGLVRAINKKYWTELLFSKELADLLTTDSRGDYLSKINDMAVFEFNERNIFALKEDLAKSFNGVIDAAIMKLWNLFTHKHSMENPDNIHYYNGWKHNKAFKCNSKVIIPLADPKIADYFSRYSFNDTCHDIAITMNYINGGTNPRADVSHYFKVQSYKKGTTHLTFKFPELLKKFNLYCGKRFNWLPADYGTKPYNDLTPEEKAVANEFEGAESYNDTYNNRQFYLTTTPPIPK